MGLTLVYFSISVFLAINMGASGFSIAFTPSYGSGIIKRNKAVALFFGFVVLGAVLVGPRVVETLSTRLVDQITNPVSGVVILSSAVITMFAANILKVPQSTSFIMVSAFIGAGLYYENVNYQKLLEIVIFAIVFSALSFIATYIIIKRFYPLTSKNMHLHEKVCSNNKLIKKLILFTDCYSGFAIGTNNVANVIAPIFIIGTALNVPFLFVLFSLMFGIGALTMGKGNIDTLSKNIIPLGEISASIISLVTSNFVIIASMLGLPAPYVQFTTFSVLAICMVKDGFRQTSGKKIVLRIFSVWLIVPVVAVVISWSLHHLLIR
ncbi:inorganic phosphate transporter [Chitinispirillales bacterium ANBcel5]|uniref:inorganic phosphate transporter n=1 Tax=Cellulosispirillum alkaliphilum TaxID=3039283 RepID=UPI002A59119F|nr:inorganic phosphate transporter [Chitinispirillales bacterium ANBcel5]